MEYFGLDTWHLLFDKLSHNDKAISFFCNSFDFFPKFSLSIQYKYNCSEMSLIE